MTFNDNVQIDTSGMGGSGGSGGGGGLGRGGMVAGGGIGGLLLLLLGLLFPNLTGGGGNDGGTSTSVVETTTSGVSTASGNRTLSDYENQIGKACKTGADANKYTECRILATYTSAESYWKSTFARANKPYTKPGIRPFRQQIQTACGGASSETGPFYCPADQKIYIDPAFFNVLTQRFGSSDGALAQEYVVAHEFGHHIQHELNLLKASQQNPQGADSGSVRVELMADCLAGVWANNASKPDANGNAFLKPLTEQDIKDALSAAASVGDDRIQESTQGRSRPETYTHGTSAQRQKWFIQGYQSGTINQCNTINASNLG